MCVLCRELTERTVEELKSEVSISMEDPQPLLPTSSIAITATGGQERTIGIHYILIVFLKCD